MGRTGTFTKHVIILGNKADKGMNSNNMTTIEKDKLVPGERTVAEVMNNYFANISQGLN